METKQAPLGEGAKKYVMNIALDLGLDAYDPKLAKIVTSAPEMSAAEVNKKLVLLAKSTHKKSPKTLTKQQEDQLLRLQTVSKDRIITEKKNRVESEMESADECYSNYMSAIGNVARLSQQVKLLESGDGETYVDQVRDVLKNPFYTLSDVSGETISFTTANVQMRFEKKRANLKYDIDLGQFRVVINPGNGSCEVHGSRDNLDANGYRHPHVKPDGKICWGNAIAAFQKIATEGDIRPALSALDALLRVYNDESPYMDIEHFAIAVKNRDLLRGKLGDTLIDPKEISSVYFGYGIFRTIDLNLAKCMKYPAAYCLAQNGIITVAGVCKNNNPNVYVELVDGSFVRINRIFTQRLQGTLDGTSLRVSTLADLDANMANRLQNSSIGTGRNIPINFVKLMALEEDVRDTIITGISSGRNLSLHERTLING